ncbi:MAG: transporter substrate-binding domain-containing protein, partial [Clostridia bacterium]|nr:transporter substrate-binding domain-containing protein [Clostridia bacterium]
MKKFIALLLALSMVFCFAACGGNDAPEDETEAPDATEKTVVVGYTIYSPMNYLDENNELVGFDTELAEKVFGNLGYKVIFQEIE